MNVYVAIGEWGEVPIAPENILETFTGEFQINIGHDELADTWHIDGYEHHNDVIDR